MVGDIFLVFSLLSVDLCTLHRLLGGLHCGLINAALYNYCITNFTNLAAVQKPVWYFTSMSSCVCQALMARIIRSIQAHICKSCTILSHTQHAVTTHEHFFLLRRPLSLSRYAYLILTGK